MKKYPLKLSYIAKSAIWGGNTLRREWGKVTDGENIAETWELSVREKEMARIENGAASGMTLAEYFSAAGQDSVSVSFREGERFPLLVKFIDAAAPLSVQVHPDNDYAGRVEKDSGKTEMWYILDAAEGSTLIYGLRDGITAEDYARAVAEGKIESAMNYVSVKAGDCFFIPAGMVHAIGEGILIAEIQQNSDLTYRVYDYDRVGADGKKRELHTEKALDVVRPFGEDEVYALRYSEGYEEGILVNNEYFKVWELYVNGESSITADEQSFISVLCVDGEGSVSFDGEVFPVRKGDSYFLPAGMGCAAFSGKMKLICSKIQG